nr:influenza virus NS1A-binding protein homolog isoform X2 [Ipomoea batatas]
MTNKFGNLKIASHPNFRSSKQLNEEWNSWTSEERAERHNIQPLLETPGPSVGRDYLGDQSSILSENFDMLSVVAKARLPAPHFAYVKKISLGLPLFLFNYRDRKLHGVFEAAGHGQLKIEERCFNVDGETNGTRRKNYDSREGAEFDIIVILPNQVQSRVEYQKLKNRVLQAGPEPSSQQFTEKDSQ